MEQISPKTSLMERITKQGQPTEYLQKEVFDQQVKKADQEAQKKLLDERLQNKIKISSDILGHAGVPARFMDKYFSTFNDGGYQEKKKALDICSRYAKNFKSSVKPNGVNMILTGSPGTGKTHLAVAVLQSVILGGDKGLFSSVSEMLRVIRGTYSSNSKMSESEAFDSFVLPELLVLDEVGVAIGDEEKRKAMVFDVINARYNAMKPTILIGNLTPDEMERYLGIRVWDRMKEGGGPVIPFTWESFR